MTTSRKIAIFTDKYPLIGPIVWILSAQYFASQLLAASAWASPGYSWAKNVISDLGNTACGVYSQRYVCSPDHATMNASFIMLGITMALGSLLIYQEFRESKSSLVGFILMALAGLGTILVGLFPENTVASMHFIGAVLALGVGNIGIIVLALAIRRARPAFRVYSYLSGIIALVAFVLFGLGIYFGLGAGGMERVASYPQTIWLILFGLYMTTSHDRLITRKHPSAS